MYDIFNHLVYHLPNYDKQGFAAFKSIEDYSLFHDESVESLLKFALKLLKIATLGADNMGELSWLDELTRFAELTRFV